MFRTAILNQRQLGEDANAEHTSFKRIAVLEIDSMRIFLIAVLLLLVMDFPRAEPELVFERNCLTAVAMTDHTKCFGPDEKHLSCTGFKVSFDPSCGQWHAKTDVSR